MAHFSLKSQIVAYSLQASVFFFFGFLAFFDFLPFFFFWSFFK
jgi:hypothetical protein